MEYNIYVSPVNMFDLYTGDISRRITEEINERSGDEVVRVRMLMECIMRKGEEDHKAGFRDAIR